MRTLIAVLALAVSAARVAVAAETPHIWNRWGIAPYASSFAEACRKAPEAIDGFTAMPQPVREQFKKLLGADCSGGAEVWLTPHQKLDAMWSGGSKPHVMQNVAVGELPVAKSPDGRPYRKGAVAESAKAHEWTFTYEGVQYALDAPDVCFNWAYRTVGVPPAAPEASALPLPQKTFVTNACPSGYTLIANAWSLASLPGGFFGGLRGEAEKLIAAANARNSEEATLLTPYEAPDVSRTLGKRLREEVKTRAPITDDIRIRYLDQKTGEVVQELGAVKLVRGVGIFHFPSDPRKYIVETLWPADFLSPAFSGGERRLRLFPAEWGKFCAMNEHGVIP